LLLKSGFQTTYCNDLLHILNASLSIPNIFTIRKRHKKRQYLIFEEIINNFDKHKVEVW
jgi:hypothetical protein